MKIAELLQINPQHLDELRSFFAGYEFTDVEIVAHETAPVNFNEPLTFGYSTQFETLKFDGVFRGKNHMHAIFTDGEDDSFYCVSFVHIGEIEDRIIFKLTVI